MSKLSFRARALDASKPMPIYMADEVPDLPDFSAINRAVPQMPTGMEKEEESEHHLQRAISAQQVYGSANHLVIPTPEFDAIAAEYEKLYDNSCKQTKQYIHMQPLSMEQDIPDYNMDAEDEIWVRKQAKTFDITSLKFEVMMDRLEKGSGQQVVSLKEAKLLLKEDDDLIIAVYDYWLNKRLRIMQLGDAIPGTAALLQGCGLIPQVKQEKRDGSTGNNPYVAFRRRTEKMQTRKNRKNDEASYEKMLKLKRDLSRAVTLLEMVKRREKSKREAIHLTLEVFEKRYQMNDHSGEVLRECEELSRRQPSFTIPAIPNGTSYGSWASKEETKKKREYKKRKHKAEASARQKSSSTVSYTDAQPHFPEIRSSDEDLSPVQSPATEEEQDPDGIFAFRRMKGCQYQAPNPELVSSWPWSDKYKKGVSDKRYRYSCTSLRTPKRCVGFARRRIGRGGRVLLDRAWTPFDDCFEHLEEEETEPSFAPSSPSTSSPPPPSMLSSVRRQSTSLPLSHILGEIQSKRLLHFRPKTPPPQEPEPMLADQVAPSQILTYPTFAVQQQTTTSCIPSSLVSDVTIDTGTSSGAIDSSAQNVLQEGPSQTQDTQDSQLVEVDVVGADGPSTPELTASFGSLPTSQFVTTSSEIPSASSSQTPSDKPPSLVQPAVVSMNHTGTKNVVSNHSLVDITKAPSGHSTAPAATVLQLNYPIPKSKPATTVSLLSALSSTSATSTSKVATDSANKKPSAVRTNANSVETKSTDLVTTSTVSTVLTVPALSERPRTLTSTGKSISEPSSSSAVVKRIAQANNLAVLTGDRHEDNSPHINNQSVPMEVT